MRRHLRPLMLVLPLTACTLALNPIPAGITGQIELKQGTGVSTFAPTVCESGALAMFFGADLADARLESTIRIVVDPMDGPEVRFTDKTRSLIKRISRDDCRTYDVLVEPTAWSVNDVRDVRGHLTVDCETGDGTKIDGSIEFKHCH